MWNTCGFSRQRRDHVCTFSVVNSTCAAAYCRCCHHLWGEECPGSCGVSCHPSPCWSPSNAAQPARDETQRVGSAAAAAPDEAATGMISWTMQGKKMAWQQMPFFLLPSLSFSLFTFCTVSVAEFWQRADPSTTDTKACIVLEVWELAQLNYCCSDIEKKKLISSFVGWLYTLKHYLYYNNINSVITVWILLCYVLYKHVRRTMFLLHTVYSWDRS